MERDEFPGAIYENCGVFFPLMSMDYGITYHNMHAYAAVGLPKIWCSSKAESSAGFELTHVLN